MSGESSQKSISKAFPINMPVVVEILLLLFLGALAVTLRAKLRTPINTPGHHGLEVMAIFIIGRYITGFKFGSSISSLAAALLIFVPVIGIKDPFLPVIYLLMGVTIDMMFYLLKNKKFPILIFGVIGAIAYSVIPLSRLIITLLTKYPYGAFVKHGYLTPVITHILFGLAGGLLGAGLVFSIKKLKLFNK